METAVDAFVSTTEDVVSAEAVNDHSSAVTIASNENQDEQGDATDAQGNNTGAMNWGDEDNTSTESLPTPQNLFVTGETETDPTPSRKRRLCLFSSYYPAELGPRYFGQVDSFDAKKGWGFIHEFQTGRVFLYTHSEVRPKYSDDRLGEDCIRNFKNCLHQGEYIEFCIGSKPGTDEPCAKWITGPRNGTIQMYHAVIKYIMYRDCRTGKRVRPGPGSRSGQRERGGGGGGGGRAHQQRRQTNGNGGYQHNQDHSQTGSNPPLQQRRRNPPPNGW